jgi:hypothetical protein
MRVTDLLIDRIAAEVVPSLPARRGVAGRAREVARMVTRLPAVIVSV